MILPTYGGHLFCTVVIVCGRRRRKNRAIPASEYSFFFFGHVDRKTSKEVKDMTDPT